MCSIKIQMASESDAEELLALYRPYVENTAVTFEYEVPSPAEFRARIRQTLTRFPYLKAVCGGEILGYAYASPFKMRAAYAWAVETSIYVKRGAHRRGVGTALYQTLEQILKRQNITNVNACIVYPHPESVGFHERFGYRTVAHFTKCGYKLGAWHDMIWMEKILTPHPDKPLSVLPVTELDVSDLIES